MSGLGDDEIDPAMMAALMATTALVAQGASNEEVSELIHYGESVNIIIKLRNNAIKCHGRAPTMRRSVNSFIMVN